jgi:hypothetical protein
MATLTAPELQFLSSQHIAARVWAEGDSYVSGAGTGSFTSALRTALDCVVISSAVGGATMEDVRSHLRHYRSMIRQCERLIIWDGRHNGYVDAESYTDVLQEGLEAVGIPFVVIPACVPYGITDASQEEAIRDEYLLRWPADTYDWRDDIPNNGTAVDQNQMLDLGGGSYDTAHLGQGALDLAAAGVANHLDPGGE